MHTPSVRDSFEFPKDLNPGRIALMVGVAGLVVSAIGFFVQKEQFFFSYLTAFVFWVTIGLGGLFFSMLHHLVGATWSVVIRRISESLMMVLPFMLIFFLPIVLGMHDLYHWTHEEYVAQDKLLSQKTGYLNQPFFYIRTVGYFVIWFFLGRILFKKSVQQDETGDKKIAERMRQISAPGMVVFAVTLTFAAFDWLMSLDPHWYSTIFGVYIFTGSFLGMLAVTTLVALGLRKKGVLENTITIEHYHDLGKLLFAFTVFWAYIAFSQYFLIWYGNIPEEVAFYLHRWHGSWVGVSLLIGFGHFAVPFLIMMTRAAKRNLKLLKIMSFWYLFIHYVDLHWIVLPTLHKHGVSISGLWLDLATMVGIGGIFIWLFWRRFAAQAMVPANDPKFEDSIRFINA